MGAKKIPHTSMMEGPGTICMVMWFARFREEVGQGGHCWLQHTLFPYQGWNNIHPSWEQHVETSGCWNNVVINLWAIKYLNKEWKQTFGVKPVWLLSWQYTQLLTPIFGDISMDSQPASAASAWKLSTGIYMGANVTAFHWMGRGVLPM